MMIADHVTVVRVVVDYVRTVVVVVVESVMMMREEIYG
jgi:hypothetical protein